MGQSYFRSKTYNEKNKLQNNNNSRHSEASKHLGNNIGGESVNMLPSNQRQLQYALPCRALPCLTSQSALSFLGVSVGFSVRVSIRVRVRVKLACNDSVAIR